MVYGGGANIDTAIGITADINAPLAAPAGNGVSSAALVTGGSGYLDTPLVVITGGGGTGATATATIDPSGNLTGIVMTNPGSGYTDAPAFTPRGGGVGNTGTVTGTATLVANQSGAVTKTGLGTLNLGAANSDSGDTVVNGGTPGIAIADTLANSADVRLASGTFLNLNFPAATPDTVDEFYINGVAQAAGLWGASGSGAPNQSTQITGTGRLMVTTGTADPFAGWIGGFGLALGDQDKTDGPDGDGSTNVEEFALDGNPNSGASSGKVRSRIETVGADQALVITLPVRVGATFTGTPAKTSTIDDLLHIIRGSNELATFDQGVTEIAPSFSNPAMPAPGDPLKWSYRTFRLTMARSVVLPRGDRKGSSTSTWPTLPDRQVLLK